MSEANTDLEKEVQMLLLEINDVLHHVMLTLKELNQMTEKNGDFSNSINETNQHLENLKSKLKILPESPMSPSLLVLDDQMSD